MYHIYILILDLITNYATWVLENVRGKCIKKVSLDKFYFQPALNYQVSTYSRFVKTKTKKRINQQNRFEKFNP